MATGMYHVGPAAHPAGQEKGLYQMPTGSGTAHGDPLSPPTLPEIKLRSSGKMKYLLWVCSQLQILLFNFIFQSCSRKPVLNEINWSNAPLPIPRSHPPSVIS